MAIGPGLDIATFGCPVTTRSSVGATSTARPAGRALRTGIGTTTMAVGTAANVSAHFGGAETVPRANRTEYMPHRTASNTPGRLGSLAILALLGGGGFSACQRAEQATNTAQVALAQSPPGASSVASK